MGEKAVCVLVISKMLMYFFHAEAAIAARKGAESAEPRCTALRVGPNSAGYNIAIRKLLKLQGIPFAIR